MLRYYLNVAIAPVHGWEVMDAVAFCVPVADKILYIGTEVIYPVILDTEPTSAQPLDKEVKVVLPLTASAPMASS
jgi:hypothetical protein